MKTPRHLALLAAASAVGALALGASSCAPSGFADPSLITSVRILASSASEPYAKPGDDVTVQVLAYDGRPTKPEPMAISWLPFPCINPIEDAYYACFAQFGGASAASGDAGASTTDAGGSSAASRSGGSAMAGLQAGVDLTPLLKAGPSMSVTVPADIIASHPPVTGGTPYGLIILFNFACAGHLEYVPPDPANFNPQQIPIACFDSQHNPLGADDYVFGFTRIYASATISDTNPVITAVDAPGGPLAVTQGATSALSAAVCTLTPPSTSSSSVSGNCPHIAVGPIIAPPAPGREVWADFFTTAGSLSSDARLLYSTAGSIGDPSATDDDYLAPATAGGQLLWIIVHDDHNGASWVTVPVSLH